MTIRTWIGSWLTRVAAQAALADCPPLQPGENEFLRAQVQIRVADHASIGDVLTAIEAVYAGTSIRRAIERHDTYLLQVPPGELDCDVLEVLIESLVDESGSTSDLTRPLRWAELNYETETTEGSTGTVFVSFEHPNAAQQYEQQYATGLLGLETANAFSTGRRVSVAIVDTGVDRHHALLRDVLLPGYNFVTDSTDTNEQRDGIDSDTDGQVDEMFGHGTFMAGLVHHVAPDARILPVVVLDNDGQGEAFRVAEGIYYAIDRGVEVINLSAGSTYESAAVSDAIDAARERGILVIAAAGNDNRREPPRYPAISGDVIGVAATDDQDHRAAFSNYHSDVLLSAPGASGTIDLASIHPLDGIGDLPAPTSYDPQRSIISTLPDDQFGFWEGTSVATAFVSGTAALLRAQHPEWPANSTTAESLEELLLESTRDIDALNPGFEEELGVGRIDPAAATAVGPIQPKAGDVNNDGQVTLDDLALLLADFGHTHSAADLDANGRVDLSDLAKLLTNFGQ